MNERLFPLKKNDLEIIVLWRYNENDIEGKLVQPTLINDTFRLSKFPSAALSSIIVATATTHSSALQAENLSCAKHIVN